MEKIVKWRNYQKTKKKMTPTVGDTVGTIGKSIAKGITSGIKEGLKEEDTNKKYE